MMIDITEPAPAAQQTQADQSLCARELAEKYSSSGGSWPEHPTYPRSEWKKEVEQDSVLCGYWDWVVSQLEQAAGDAKALSASFATVIRDDVNADRLAFSPALRKLAAKYGADFKNRDDPEARAIIYWDARTRTLGARIHLANSGVNPSFKADVEAAAAELAQFSRTRFRCFFFDESLSLTDTSTAEPSSPHENPRHADD
jgi:hypothetical protein